MKLEELRLKKEELPILNENCFKVPIHPIHPRLLDPHIILPDDLASRIFPETTTEWFKDLKEYRENADLDNQTREWYDEVWLKEEPVITREGTLQVIRPGHWKDEYITHENGFARCLSISRDFGGSFYFPGTSELECSEMLPESGESRYIRFSSQKAKEFSFEEIPFEDGKYLKIHVYGHHNIDHYPGALFLRNWAINYMNKAFEFITD